MGCPETGAAAEPTFDAGDAGDAGDDAAGDAAEGDLSLGSAHAL